MADEGKKAVPAAEMIRNESTIEQQQLNLSLLQYNVMMINEFTIMSDYEKVI